MEVEFTRSFYWKIFYCAMAVGFALFVDIGFIQSQVKDQPALILFPLLSTLFGILVVISQFISKVIISADYIVKINITGKRKLLTINVKGVSIGEKYISIIPISDDYKKITINNYIDYPDSEDLTSWLKENFADLDAAALKDQQAKVLTDPRLGATEIERKRKLTAAKIVAVVYSIIGVVLGAFGIASQNNFVVYLLMGYPLAGVLITGLNPLIKFVSNSKRSVYPFIMVGVLPPVFILFISALSEFEIYNHQNAWLPFFGIAATLFFLFFKTSVNDALPVKGQIIIMLIAGLLYGYGSTIHINCDFDKSSPKLIQTSVYNKWIEHNKGAHYHLKLASWDGDQKPRDIEVSHATYNSYIEGGSINVYLKNGLLNIPWYSLYK
ncbi:hypothetical protein [Mucilaginibacter flavidus]|uniref:hypothetical protein n=1 Tax=Mucilaginibacter flavidus TaxID=2949309 RepID=UPI002093165A|nr:hypothetical protein [Mucilaginibacter flavidus]MCO5945672.1 hypothetical protein [Mucilaginibacter flavidus]